MLNNFYNWLFRGSTADQIIKLQLDKAHLVELETCIKFDKLIKIHSTRESLLVTSGYLKDNKTWKLVFNIPKNSQQYILTNFNISNLNYSDLKVIIDDQTIIHDSFHPWKGLWRDHQEKKNDSEYSIPYLTFPIQKINNQSIQFELTFDKSILQDPKDIYISYDMYIFKNYFDKTKFFNVWKVNKFICLSPKSHNFNSSGIEHIKDDWFLDVNQIYYEIIITIKDLINDLVNDKVEEFPLETIRLTDNEGSISNLYLGDFERSGKSYRLILTNNYVDGLCASDWKSIELIPKIGYREKIDKIDVLSSSILQFKNHRLLDPPRKSKSLRFI